MGIGFSIDVIFRNPYLVCDTRVASVLSSLPPHCIWSIYRENFRWSLTQGHLQKIHPKDLGRLASKREYWDLALLIYVSPRLFDASLL